MTDDFIDENNLRRALKSADMEKLAAPLAEISQSIVRNNQHGDSEKWQNIIKQLPDITASSNDFTRDAIRIGADNDCDDVTKAQLKQLLLQLNPWRKGPFDLFGVTIDSEWRANLKWARLAEKISDLRDRRVLDVGCGNGYYLFRILGEGARLALGIDPTQLFIAQFAALKNYCRDAPAFVLAVAMRRFSKRMRRRF